MTKTLLMIHGVGCGGDAWDGMVPHFQAAGFSCHAPTLFPELRTVDAPPAEIAQLRFNDYIEETSKWARELADVDGQKPAVIGHSMGGLLAQKLAERGDVSKAVLLTPAAPEDCSVNDPRVFRTFWNILKHGIKKAETMGHKVGPKGLAYGVWNKTPADQHAALYAQARYDSGGVYKDLLDGVSLDESRIAVPTLTICASKDRATVPKSVRKLAKKLQNAQVQGDFKEYPDHAHWILGEPGVEHVCRDIAEWLSKHG